MTKESGQIKVMDMPVSLKKLKLYLRSLKGRKILTFDETNTAQGYA